VFARPLAYGSVTLHEWRRGGCGAAFRQACGWASSAPTRTTQCGTLHWGSPAGSSTSVPSGMVASSSTWRDELAWWRTEVPPTPAACAQGPLLNAGAGVDAASARQDAGARHTGPSNTAVEGAPDTLPAAPPADPETWRCILAMELCEAGACVRAARRGLLELGGQQTHVWYLRWHSGCLRVPAHK